VNILIASDSFFPSLGGVEIVTYNLAKNLVERGHSVSALVNLRRFPFKHYEEIDNIRVYRVRMGIFDLTFRSTLGFLRQTPAATLSIYRILKKEKPEIVNLHFITSGVATYIRFFQNIFRYKLVASAHGSDILMMPSQSRSYLRLAQKVIRQADAVTACSRNLLGSINKVTDVGNGEAIFIYNGIDIENMEQRKEDDNFIFSAGRLVYEKGIDILIQAFRIVKNRDFSSSLVIAGDGPERERLQFLIADLGLQDSIVLLGMITPDQVKQYLKRCTFVVVPSRSEAFGLVNLEAMASGKAVIASDIGGIPELVRDGYNGLLFRAGDVLDLANKMSLLIKDKNLRLTLAENGQRFVNGNFSWSKMTDSYEQLYFSLLEQRA
jgi:glycosyltransferase involved in cell wall biosynthesis